MKTPNRYRAKVINSEKYVTGYYLEFPETTYAFKEDYDRNPPRIIHALAFHEMTDWGLPNRVMVAKIDPETLEEVEE